MCLRRNGFPNEVKSPLWSDLVVHGCSQSIYVALALFPQALDPTLANLIHQLRKFRLEQDDNALVVLAIGNEPFCISFHGRSPVRGLCGRGRRHRDYC